MKTKPAPTNKSTGSVLKKHRPSSAILWLVIFEDRVHSDEEPREILVGYSSRSRLLIVSFTHREPAVRIISARRATPRERDKHERSLFGG